MTAQPTSPVRAEVRQDGSFVRQPNAFRNRITSDGSSGYLAEPGRYHLYVSLACPWAHRSIIARRLKKLEDVIGLTVVDPIRDERGWAFRDGPGHTVDTVNGFNFLSEAYLATDPTYTGRFTVPALWDRRTHSIVTNDFHVLSTMLETEFEAYADRSVDLYPIPLREEIDAVNEAVFEDINNGVYKAGFAVTQEAYEAAVQTLFDRLDWLEERLSSQRFLVGHQLTDADIRLWVTLVRFDAVYYGHFKCNLNRIVDYPNLWGYARDLYQRPGFGDTVNFDHIKRHYYMTHANINPTRIVPLGPRVDWLAPHDRSTLR
jgi:putative glutathione S-transferase